jgi:hypothetical protein
MCIVLQFVCNVLQLVWCMLMQVATYALIWPAKRRPDVMVAAVAARDADRAAKYAQQHG